MKITCAKIRFKVTPALVKDCADRLNCNVAVGYGMTENSCATFLTPAHSGEDIGLACYILESHPTALVIN